MPDPFRDRDEMLTRRIEALETERNELRHALDDERDKRRRGIPDERPRLRRFVMLMVLLAMIGAGGLIAVMSTRRTTAETATLPVPSGAGATFAATPSASALAEHDDLGLSALKPWTSRDVHAVWSDRTETWVLGANGAAARGNVLFGITGQGSLFREQDAGVTTTLRAITRDKPLVAVGDAGTVVEIDARGAMIVSKASGLKEDLLGVMYAGRLVIAVGRHGTIARFAPEWGSWRVAESPTKRDLHAIARSTDGEWAFVVGDDGMVLAQHFGGATPDPTWHVEATSIHDDLLSVDADADEMIAVGRRGTILRRDPRGRWLPEARVTTADLYAVASVSAGGGKRLVLAVGQRGVALTREASTWRAHALVSGEDLLAIHPDPLLVVGGHGTLLGAAAYWLEK